MPPKRPRTPENDADDGIHDDTGAFFYPRKQQRLTTNPLSRRNTCDRLSALPNELSVRILSFLPIASLLDVALVSHHFDRLSSDSQLWRALYYSRFVLPRALRIPGFRNGTRRHGAKLHYSARRAVWADGGHGKRGGLVDMRDASGGSAAPRGVDWKRQYKLRHNWSRGKASVEELEVGDSASSPPAEKTLVKVVEGLAVTADATSGLRAWDLKTKDLLAQVDLKDDEGTEPSPTCLSVDEQPLVYKKLDVCVGFIDGSFGVWRLDLQYNKIVLRHRHAKSSNGGLIGVAYRHPFLLTATESVLVSLYDYDRPLVESKKKENSTASSTGVAAVDDVSKLNLGYESETMSETEPGPDSEADDRAGIKAKRSPEALPAPVLVTSLKSHSSQAPLALSIRKSGGSVVASIAYTFLAIQGWSIGIQDLHIRHKPGTISGVVSTRLAYTTPVSTTPPSTVLPGESPGTSESPLHPEQRRGAHEGPTALCYTHPYLLATLPDNTLVLHVCTSSATALSVSPGIRLWGHTSGISDAEITARGKAVSVSCRGDEIRVWELEGRADGRSIMVKPNSNQEDVASAGGDRKDGSATSNREQLQAAQDQWDDRRNWVGFDDEMVIVLKEAKDGRESLVVYDFT